MTWNIIIIIIICLLCHLKHFRFYLSSYINLKKEKEDIYSEHIRYRYNINKQIKSCLIIYQIDLINVPLNHFFTILFGKSNLKFLFYHYCLWSDLVICSKNVWLYLQKIQLVNRLQFWRFSNLSWQLTSRRNTEKLSTIIWNSINYFEMKWNYK